jgi:hypothetical protein
MMGGRISNFGKGRIIKKQGICNPFINTRFQRVIRSGEYLITALALAEAVYHLLKTPKPLKIRALPLM